MRRIRNGRCAVALGLAAVIGACGGGSGSESGSEGLASGDDYSVASALGEIPAEVVGEEILIFTGDLTAATGASGLERPETFDDVDDWLLELTGSDSGGPAADPEVFVPLGDLTATGVQMRQYEEYDAEVGWSILDVEAFVETTTAPDLFAVVSGDLGEASLSEELEDLGDGVVSHGTGDDFAGDLAETSVVSRLGRPTRFAAHGDRIALSPSTPAVEQWLDGESEATGASLRAVADALDEAGVYAAVLHERADGFSLRTVLGAASRVVVEAFEDKDWLPPVAFSAVGVGWGVDGNEPVVTIAIAHADEDAAQENVGAFEQMLEEGESIQYGRPLSAIYDLQDVTANGATVVATVHLRSGVPLPVVFQAVTELDAPFVHA